MEAVPRSSNPLHVAALVFPFGSHAGPLLSLLMKIAASSPNVTFSFFSTAQSIAMVFPELSDKEKLENVKAYEVHDGFMPSGHPLQRINLFLQAIPGNYRRAMEEVMAETRRRFTCWVTDAFFWFGAETKWVPLSTAGPHSLSCFH